MKKQYDISAHELNGKNGKIYIGIPRERIYIPAFVDNGSNPAECGANCIDSISAPGYPGGLGARTRGSF